MYIIQKDLNKAVAGLLVLQQPFFLFLWLLILNFGGIEVRRGVANVVKWAWKLENNLNLFSDWSEAQKTTKFHCKIIINNSIYGCGNKNTHQAKSMFQAYILNP